ncbi:MAG: DMT family transporter, partial [Aigarchaeota archaeon]|nr:DMT family transporter [Aigarchaeota archaeon]
EMVRASKRESAIVLLAGAALAVHFASWISSLSLTSVTSSVVIVNSSPVFVAVIGRYLLREGVTPRMALGIAAALLGCSIIAFADLGLGGVNVQGDIYALVGALAAAVYVLGGRMIRRTTGLLAYVLPVYAICSLILGGAAVLLKTPLHPYQEREYWIFLALAIVPTIFGHTLYNWALRFVPASVVAVSLLGEPVGATALAGVILHEYPTPLTVFGAVLTLTGIYVTARK